MSGVLLLGEDVSDELSVSAQERVDESDSIRLRHHEDDARLRRTS